MKHLIAAAMAATLLGGCQSIFGHHARLDVRPAGGEVSSATYAVALAEGRQELMRGEVGLAIVSLQTAATQPDTAAAAHNGLGVAYAMLGRGDLAERYFQQAVAEDPAEAKYAANLARYYQSREAALARASAAPAVVAVAAGGDVQGGELAVAEPLERVLQSAPGTARITASAGTTPMRRISANEVAIRTLPEFLVAKAPDGRRRSPRFTAAAPVVRAPAYPLRIELAH